MTPSTQRRILGQTFVGLLTVMGGLTAFHARHAARVHVLVHRAVEDHASIPGPTAVCVMSLQHREWAADLLFASALLYFGDSMHGRTAQKHLQTYARVIESVDPQFRRAYLWASNVSIYSHRRITRQSVENANAHLERGLLAFPGDGEMIYQLGFNLWFELPPYLANDAERRVARGRGAVHLRQAAAMGHGPTWLPLMAARALEDDGQDTSAVELLRDSLIRTEDAVLRGRMERRIRDLSRDGAQDPGLIAAQALERERRERYPFISPTLYLFVGPPIEGITPPSSRDGDQ
ncbi:MAG: hypothetical protein Q8Q09_20810 [Deltaproteobacteria bacterium]|nr:hypothetical protein [Deltaproteobacteria bacterium]